MTRAESYVLALLMVGGALIYMLGKRLEIVLHRRGFGSSLFNRRR